MEDQETKAKVERLVAFISSPAKPHKRPSNHLSDVEIEAKRLRIEAFEIGANSSNQQAVVPSNSNSSVSTSSDSIGGLAKLGDIYQALEEAEEAEQSQLSDILDTFIGHVLSLLLFILELNHTFADNRSSSSSLPVATNTSARSTKTTLPIDSTSLASTLRSNTTNMRWT